MISEKGLYGMVSGLFTTMLLQPFENIKMALMIPPKQIAEQIKNNNSLKSFSLSSKFIYRTDGILGFYKGLVAASLKATFGCYIYFTGLRYFEQDNMSAAKNFIVSSLSRIFSTFFTNPLSIVQTRFQLADFHGYNSVRSALVQIYKKQGFTAFFSGGLSSCIKQGTFGGFYYMFYEEMKDMGYHNFMSGIISGVLATAITHPFELIRAKLQTKGLQQKYQVKNHNIWKQLQLLSKNKEWFKGLTPRLIKKPVANTLTFYIFQIIQDLKKEGVM